MQQRPFAARKNLAFAPRAVRRATSRSSRRSSRATAPPHSKQRASTSGPGPRDAMALAPSTGVFGLIGFSGKAGREGDQLALLEPLATHYCNDWWFWAG